MADKTSFTPEEWKDIRDVPQLVSLAVASAGASGLVGTMKEAFSSSASLVEAMKSDNPLLRAICSREELSAAQKALRESLGQFQGSDFGAAREKVASLALDKVRSALDVIRKKGGPGDAEAFTRFVDSLGRRVAEAAKEGGFLGFGGERVSAAESEILAKLGAALGPTTRT